ncbi:MAG: hypothetical protein ACK41F_02355 [Fimbriimonadaceae bacterium]
MVTPFDWQESIGHRVQYVENKLAQGLPVICASVADGVAIVAWRRNARKIFEIYDRLAMAAIGQQSDVEAIRSAAVEFAHREGFARSESDVTVERVAATLSQPIKRAFGDLTVAPFVVRSVFAQVGDDAGSDRLLLLGFDGDYSYREKTVALAGDAETEARLLDALASEDWRRLTSSAAVPKLLDLWRPADDLGDDVRPEAAVLLRSGESDRRLRNLDA